MTDTTQGERLEMDAGAGESDYPYVLIFTTDKFVISAFGFEPEHCEDRLQCILKGRYESQKGDREMRRI